MKLNSTRIIASIVALIVLGIFIAWQAGLFEKSASVSASEAQTSGPPSGQSAAVPVKAQVIQSQALSDYITVSGSTFPSEEVMVSSEVPGKVKIILFREGSNVSRGDTLVMLDDEELQAQRNRLEVQAELNEKIAERLKGLYEKEGVSLQEYEVAEAEYDKAISELTLLDAQLEKRVIRAPFSGRLGLKLISEGSYLAPGTPIVPLVKYDPIKIEFSIPEKYNRDVRKGTRIEFQVEGIKERLTARVEASDPTIDPTTRTFRLKATASNPRGRILPGAFASVRVELEKFDEALMIPTEAVVPELGGKKVFVFRNGKVEAVQVETGIRQEARIQITEGLSAGDTIITTGVLQIRSGSEVQITSFE